MKYQVSLMTGHMMGADATSEETCDTIKDTLEEIKRLLELDDLDPDEERIEIRLIEDYQEGG